MTEWTDCVDSSGHVKGEACAKAYAKTSAVAACTAATEGAGVAVCGAVASVLIDKAWPVVWGAAGNVVGALGDVASGIGGALSSAWQSLTGSGSPFDKGTAIFKFYGPGQVGLEAASNEGLAATVEVARQLGFSSGALGALPTLIHKVEKTKQGSVSSVLWNPRLEWERNLLEQPAWVEEFDVVGTPPAGWPAAHSGVRLRFSGRNKWTAKTPWGPYYFVPVSEFGESDVPSILLGVQQGWAHRMTAIPGALVATTAKLVVRRQMIDNAAIGRRRLLWGSAIAGIGVAVMVGWQGWERRWFR